MQDLGSRKLEANQRGIWAGKRGVETGLKGGADRHKKFPRFLWETPGALQGKAEEAPKGGSFPKLIAGGGTVKRGRGEALSSGWGDAFSQPQGPLVFKDFSRRMIRVNGLTIRPRDGSSPVWPPSQTDDSGAVKKLGARLGKDRAAEEKGPTIAARPRCRKVGARDFLKSKTK